MAPRALQHVEEGQTGRFLRLGEKLAKMGLRDTSRFLYDGAQALSHVSAGSQGHILDLCDGLLASTPDAVPPFLKSLDPVLNRITLQQLDQWYQHGVELLNENPESGIAFFKIESNTSESMLETLSSSLDLERVKGIMRLYTRALSGENIEVLSTAELVRRQIGWVDQDTASTDGTKVYLPPVIDNYNDKSQNFAWFKVVATHQVSHLEFGSFQFDFVRPANVFDDRRFRMEEAIQARIEAIRTATAEHFQLLDSDAAPSIEVGEGPGGTMRVYTDIGRFLALFEDRRMAFDLFSVLEDCRLDYRIKTEYPGIRRPALDVQGDALTQRPRIEELPLQEALIELLVHMSLDRFEGLPGAAGLSGRSVHARPHHAPPAHRPRVHRGYRRGGPARLRDHFPPPEPAGTGGRVPARGSGRSRRILRGRVPGSPRQVAGPNERAAGRTG